MDYFVLSRAVRPQEAVQLYWGGVNWRFRNEGNRAAFALDPLVYAPRFGGLDPVRLAAGLVVRGAPTVFDVHQNRVYLFFSRDNLNRWRRNRAALLRQAQANWPKAATSAGLSASSPAPIREKSDLSRLPNLDR